ncbi:MAG: hypothetical protein V4507_01950, partial [Verrucomicrobiota bacterium]
FKVSGPQAATRSELSLHTADQSGEKPTTVEVRVNGRVFSAQLPKGLGSQDKSQLAFGASVGFELPANTLKAGENQIEVRVPNGGWFTWDAMELVSRP